MSGGSLGNYAYHNVNIFIDDLYEYLQSDHNLSEQTHLALVAHLPFLYYMSSLMQAIDYLASNDYSEDSFQDHLILDSQRIMTQLETSYPQWFKLGHLSDFSSDD